MNTEIRQMLTAVREGRLSVDDALLKIKAEPFEDIGFAKVDLHRAVRQGLPEVIYGAGKTAAQIAGVVKTMRKNGQELILITRLSEEAAKETAGLLGMQMAETSYPDGGPEKDISEDGAKQSLQYYKDARIGMIGTPKAPDGIGRIVVATGGTSDIPVAEEAAVTAAAYGNEVIRLYDVGVSGLHRLLSHKEEIMQATVIVAVAGMEGALASVIGGLADCPVIAVPTSVGYGASFHGVSALLSMLNSCASGVSVVNIDNGFGAGYLASMINHIDTKATGGGDK